MNPRVKQVHAVDPYRELRPKWGEQLVDLGNLIRSMGEAMLEDDGILGSIAGEGIANHLAALPRHIREVFLEYASDEAAAGYAADMRWIAAQEETPA
jgi:hypothetical protein